jgi:hypothetical protein
VILMSSRISGMLHLCCKKRKSQNSDLKVFMKYVELDSLVAAPWPSGTAFDF